MTTLLISDLHLGTPERIDVLRGPAFRDPLLERVEAADEIVLLGDLVEFREGPPSAALEAALPAIAALGEAARGKRVIVVPGNHDHRLIGRWLRTRRHREGAPLGLAETIAPAEASPEAERVAAALGDGCAFSYPGVWVRPDTFAMHGHHLDRHLTVPSFERIGLGAVERFGLRGRAGAGPDSYEAVFGPLYALLFALAEESPPQSGTPGAGSSTRAWNVLVGDGKGRRRLRHTLAAGVGFPAVIAGLNRAGLGPLSPRISGVELRRAGLRAIGAAVAGLAIEADHVLFGHTHRAGPFAGDASTDWRAPGGASLTNIGNWVFGRSFVGSRAEGNPYWPGTCATVGAEGPPVLERLLDGHDRPAIEAALRA